MTRPGDQQEAAATGQRLDPQRPPWPAREAEHVASRPLDDQRHGALGAVETLHHIRALGGFPEANSMEDLWNTRTKVKNVGTSMEHLEKMENVSPCTFTPLTQGNHFVRDPGVNLTNIHG